jgi:SNF2 family DNA or RNA helicase
MIALHAIWSSASTLCIWGEDSALLTSSTQRRQTKSANAPKHPFACDNDWLKEALRQINDGIEVQEDFSLRLLLPGLKDAPLSSPHLLREEGTNSPNTPQLTAWTVPSVSLSASQAVNLLLALPVVSPPGINIGDSLRFFGEVAKLALELIARGRTLPSITKRDKQFLAIWRVITYSEEDSQRLRLLMRSMPAVCRAESLNDSLEGRRPDEVLPDFLQHLADAMVRQTLGDFSFSPARKQTRAKSASASEAWLAALVSDNPLINASASDLLKLQKELNEWSSAATASVKGSLRTCFRLISPEENQDSTIEAPKRKAKANNQKWRLDFLLQATEDRSLMVSADTVWKTKGKALQFSTLQLENPQEKLLEDLGRATRLYPALEGALKTAKPVTLDLGAGGAYQFLREAAPLLEQSGFGVLVPSWWKKPTAKLGLKLKTKSQQSSKGTGMGLLGLDGLCDYQWEIALGEETISYEDFIKLASLKMPLVQVRGQWVELKQEEIDAALAFFEKRQFAGQMTTGEALRLGLGLEPSQTGLPVTGIEAEGWLGNLLNENGRQSIKTLKTPKNFAGKLRPYQERGLSWLAFMNSLGLGACLADDMGLGKTIQLLSLLMTERQNSNGKKTARIVPTLLVCPMSVVGNWQREAEKFAPALRVHVHHGAERLSGVKFKKIVKDSDLVITTYALIARDQKLLEEVEWRRIALDEAQNIKNPSAKQTQAVRNLKSLQRVALTGTPVENRLSELWSIMQFLNPGLLGSAKDFQTRFASPIERYRDEEKGALLKRITSPFILRRLKTDKSIIKDLPDKIEMKTYCNLTQEQASLYQAVVGEMLQKIEESEDITRRGLILATLMKLKQICNHPAQMLQDGSNLAGRSGKLARLEEIMEEILAEGDRVLCFTQFAEMGKMLKSHLQERFNREVMFLHGGTTKKARDAMVTRFQQADGAPIFLLSLKAGGTGLNLTAAQHVIHFDRWWNPAVEDQATDRAFRIGQTRNVQVRKFVCVGTLEERIDQMIEQKKELAERIVGTGEGWLTELSTDELRSLIALSEDAVSE